jgi:PGM1 C-terminal domain
VVVVPGLSMDADVLATVAGARHYEERQLAMLMLLRYPRTRVVYVSSTALDPAVVDYYLDLLPGLPAAHARRRLSFISTGDASAVSLTQKVLERPRVLERIRAAIGDPGLAHLSCFNVTALERRLAVQLGIPVYGCDPDLLWLGSKSGSRAVFEEAGVTLPDGARDLRDAADVVESLVMLKRRHAGLRRAVLKLDEGFSGEGNAVFSFAGCEGPCTADWVRARLPAALSFESRSLNWEVFVAKLAQMRGVVEEWVVGDGVQSPSVQLRVTPAGALETISTHDQALGGPNGQVFMGCSFPANPAYAVEVQELARRVGEVLAGRGVLGRFAVDFVSVPLPDGRWRHHAIEINLRKGGTTHTYQWLQFMTGGHYDDRQARFLTPAGLERCYTASDTLLNPAYRRLGADDLIDVAVMNGLHYDHTAQTGVVFTLIGAMAEHGKLGMVAIEASRAASQALFERTRGLLDAASH